MTRALIAVLLVAVSWAHNSLAEKPLLEGAVPQVELDVWQPQWEESVKELQEMMGGMLNSPGFAGVDSESKSAALEEVNSALEQKLSWDNIGKEYVSQMLLKFCGEELLNEIAPYRSDPELAAEIPEELTQRYTSCWIDVDLQVSNGPAMFSMSFFKTLVPPILERHGIDPNGG